MLLVSVLNSNHFFDNTGRGIRRPNFIFDYRCLKLVLQSLGVL